MSLPSRSIVCFYNKRGMDQRRQAGHELDPTILPSFSGERGSPTIERPGLQPWESLAPASAAEAHRELVVDQSATAPRQDGWPLGGTCVILLAPAGGESPDPPPIWGDTAANLGPAGPGGLTGDG